MSPSKKRATLGLLAMHKPPAKSSIRSGSSLRENLSFATFQQYPACKGYRYPATQKCIDTIQDAGYVVSPHERVIIRSSPVPELRWTVANPPICFGTVSVLSSRSAAISPELGPHSSVQSLGGTGSFSNNIPICKTYS